MLPQETHSERSPISRLVETMGGRIFRVLDWIAGSVAQDQDEDSLRRCRLLVASILVLFVFAQFFLYKVYVFAGFMSPTAWVFVCGSGLMPLNLLLLRRTRSSRSPSILLVSEFLVSFGLMAYYNGGYDAASLIWNLTIPLLAIVLVGPRFGLLCAGLIIAETVIFYTLTQAGYPFPRPLTTAQNRWFHFFGSINLIIFIAFAGWFYEVLRKNAIEQVEQVRRSLEKSEAYFRSLIENSSDFIAILNPDGTLRYTSPAHERLLGYAPGELRDKNPLDFVAPEERQALQKLILLGLKNPTAEPSKLFTFHFRHHDGSWRVLEGIGTNLLHDPAVAGLVINSRDITERQRAEEALRDSEQRYRNVIESVPDAIFTLSPEGVITALNPAFKTLTGWPREQFLGQLFTPLLHPDDLPQAMEHLQRVLRGEIIEPFELRILHQQGQIIIGEFTVTPQIRNGQVVHIFGIARDITPRKEVERLKNEIVSTVSHELRTPLASLRGFAELMLARAFPPTQQREFLTIRH
ncbi:MAG: PAS domain S-box protein [Deltaproteobacteria bacterium]|nr:PAS domain S-box protein [Deltaproteobacteria bacterium]